MISLVAGGIVSTTGCLDGSDDARDYQNEPDYHETVVVRNRSDEPVEIDLEIVHENGEGTVHSEVHTVEAGAEIDAYDFRDAPTDGVETYAITGRLDTGEEESFEFPTNACVSSPELIVEEYGTLDGIWAEC